MMIDTVISRAARMQALVRMPVKLPVKIIAFWLCLLSGTSVAQEVFDHPVHAGSPEAVALQRIADQLRNNLPVTGDIEQQKHLAILREPMISKGSFELAANGDLQWRITEPFAVTYSMETDELRRTMDGESEVIAASTEPALYGFFQLFSRLFELSLQDLNNYFSVYLLAGADEQWLIGLMPQGSRLNKVLAHIVVQGKNGVIDQVTLTEPEKDHTVLHFSYGSVGKAERPRE